MKMAPIFGGNGQTFATGTLANTSFASSNLTTGKVKIFAVNYNVLRIMSGMGGLAYSN
jgi:hypothetical protein